jgi:hypothetical protein
MKKWKYSYKYLESSESNPIENILNFYGEKGWELIYFKPLKDKNTYCGLFKMELKKS